MTALDLARTMTKTVRRQGEKQTVTLSSVGDMARFANVLRRSGIEFREVFACGGRAIKFVFTDGPIEAEGGQR